MNTAEGPKERGDDEDVLGGSHQARLGGAAKPGKYAFNA